MLQNIFNPIMYRLFACCTGWSPCSEVNVIESAAKQAFSVIAGRIQLVIFFLNEKKWIPRSVLALGFLGISFFVVGHGADSRGRQWYSYKLRMFRCAFMIFGN